MTDDFTTPSLEPSAASKIADGIKVASSGVSDAIETGLEPGMPLDIAVRAVREAPLAALGTCETANTSSRIPTALKCRI
jgi:hypothetical protein